MSNGGTLETIATFTKGSLVTNDMDQALEFIGLFVALLLLFPLFMAWFEDSMTPSEVEQRPLLPRIARRIRGAFRGLG